MRGKRRIRGGARGRRIHRHPRGRHVGEGASLPDTWGPPRPVIRLLVVAVLLAFSASAGAEEREFDLAIRGGEVPKERQLLTVRQGDEVTLRWTTDAPLTIHLHGYDIERALVPDRPASMHFSARAAGRFPIEIHPQGRGRERTLGYLEVHPR